MAKELPYFRWFPKDAEADGRYSAMSLAELGLFHRCLNFAWMNDGLPCDPREISRVLRIPHKEFLKSWERVRECFSGEDRLVNQRQEVERNHAVEKSRKAISAINSRYGRNTDVHTDVHTDVLPRAYGSGSVSVSEKKKPQEKKESKRRKSKTEFKGDVMPEDWNGVAAENCPEWKAGAVREQFERFLDYHRKNGNIWADWKAAWRTWCMNARKFRKEEQPRLDSGPAYTLWQDPFKNYQEGKQ